jgi:hypothetical protein
MAKLLTASMQTVVAVLVLIGVSIPAAAVPIADADYTFTFPGVCDDCIVDDEHPNGGPGGTGHATLTLKNYVLGANLTSANFVDFVYSSEKLGTLDADSIFSLRGNLATLDPAPARLLVEFVSGGNDYTFSSSVDGGWTMGKGISILDFGTNGIYDGQLTAAVPEPATLALVTACLIGLAATRRRG